MGVEVEWLTKEISDVTESLHTARGEVDALREEKEESERTLEEAQIGIAIIGLQDVIHR